MSAIGRKQFSKLNKKDIKYSWIYLLAALPLFLLALVSLHYNALSVTGYLVLGTVNVIQFLRPTIVGWAICFLIYLVSAIGYSYLIVTDAIKLFSSEPPSALVDIDDTLVFSLLFGYIVVILLMQWRIRPFKYQS